MSENEQLEQYRQSLIEIASETWRFRRVFGRIIGNMDSTQKDKYMSQYMWFDKRVQSALEKAGLRIENVEGQMFDVGMSVTPINIDDFDPDEPLLVVQMVEPIIMDSMGLVKSGTVLLGRVEQ